MVTLEEVEFLEPAIVLYPIYHYFSMKWNAFHGSMKKGVHVNPRRDATIFQQDFFLRLTIFWSSWRTLNFYMHMEHNLRSTNSRNN
jgi:hypothetical protein